MILSLIFSYVEGGTIFLSTKSFFPLYGRPATILFENAVPIPGNSCNSSAEAELISISLDFVADFDGPALAWAGALPALGVCQAGEAIKHSETAVSSRSLTTTYGIITPGRLHAFSKQRVIDDQE
jgi:hypothetical protein